MFLSVLWWIWTLALAAAALFWFRICTSAAHRSNFKYWLAPIERDTDDRLPHIALIVPARDEADHLPETLESLCHQNYPHLTIVFVDDDSSDATGSLADALAEQHPHLHVLHNHEPPPDGWVGKPHAIVRGYRHLQHLEQQGGCPLVDWVCFTDADIHWHPDCLRSAIRLAQKHDADVVGLYPGLRFGTWLEGVVQAQLVLALAVLFPVEKALDPRHPETLIGGAFILTTRTLYEKVGTHEAVSNLVVEDLGLGRRLKKHARAMQLAAAHDLFWCRMYDGWSDMWEGLTKNAFAGLRYNPFRVVFLLIGTTTFNIAPALSLIALTILWLVTPASLWLWPTVFALIAILLGGFALNAARSFARLPWHYALTLPLGSALYLAIILVSVRDYYLGGNRWKGRAYGTEIHPRG